MNSRRTSDWERIEPGYYRLRGTDIHVVNTYGQDVRHTGPGEYLGRWKVRIEPTVKAQRAGERTTVISRHDYVGEAKAAAITHRDAVLRQQLNDRLAAR